jgi:glyoxylase-like metal-dependent hydrolase (beta-lactamase superfamily II)
MEVYPGVHEIRSEFGGRRIHQHLFVGERVVLLDAGLASTPEATIFPYLETIGLSPKSLNLVIAMHPDVDHHGGCAVIKAASKDTLFACHAKDAALIEDPERLYKERYNFLAHDHSMGFGREGMNHCPEGVRMDLLLQGGEKVQLGPGRELEIWHTPGHSDGHLSVYDPSNQAAFTSDAVQGRGYPMIEGGWAFGPTYYCVESYLATINFLEKQPIQLLLSGHWPSMAGEEVAEFLRSSRAFVDRASALVQEHLQKHARGSTLREITDALGGVLGSWPSETNNFLQFALYGHLEALRIRGLVQRSSESPVRWKLA